MNPNDLRDALTNGVMAFPTTPFTEDGAVDGSGLRANMAHMLTEPVCAVVAAAGTGEFHVLSETERLLVLSATLENVGGRIPVMAAAGESVAAGSATARVAVEVGAAGVLLFPPYYQTGDETGLLHYYKAIADSVPGRGVIIYSRDWFNPTPAFVQTLADAIPNLIALKDGQGDMRRLQSIRARVGDARLLYIGGAGDDCVPGYYAIGLRTYTSSIANIAPRLSLALHKAGALNDYAILNDLMRRLVVPLYEMRVRRRGYEVSVMKRIMDELGMVGGPVRAPLADITSEAEQAEIRALADLYREWAA